MTSNIKNIVVVVAHIYPPVTGQRQTLTYWTIRSFHYNDYFVIGGIGTSLGGVFNDPKFLWISSNFCPMNLLLVRSHKIMIVKRLIPRRNNVTRVRIEPRLFDQGRYKNDAFTHSATLPTMRG